MERKTPSGKREKEIEFMRHSERSPEGFCRDVVNLLAGRQGIYLFKLDSSVVPVNRDSLRMTIE